MSELSIVKLWHTFEDWRLSLHFKRVEAILRKRDVSHLSPTLQQAREHYLDQLHAYAIRGVFPRNYERFIYSPCFIDRDGRDCAVAHLVRVSGHNELAQEITYAANYAYIAEMEFSELDKWAAQSGLSKDELSLIQPGYWIEFSYAVLTFALATWTTGIILSIINMIQVRRKQYNNILPSLGIIVGVLLVLLTAICMYAALVEDYPLYNHPEVPRILQLHALDAGNAYMIIGLISLFFAVVAITIGKYSMQKFRQMGRKSNSLKAKT